MIIIGGRNAPLYLGDLMKLTITKSNGTKLIKEFNDADVESAKANGWEEVDKPKTKTFKKSKGGK